MDRSLDNKSLASTDTKCLSHYGYGKDVSCNAAVYAQGDLKYMHAYHVRGQEGVCVH